MGETDRPAVTIAAEPPSPRPSTGVAEAPESAGRTGIMHGDSNVKVRVTFSSSDAQNEIPGFVHNLLWLDGPAPGHRLFSGSNALNLPPRLYAPNDIIGMQC